MIAEVISVKSGFLFIENSPGAGGWGQDAPTNSRCKENLVMPIFLIC